MVIAACRSLMLSNTFAGAASMHSRHFPIPRGNVESNALALAERPNSVAMCFITICVCAKRHAHAPVADDGVSWAACLLHSV